MSLANKLYKIGQQVSKDDIKEIIEVKEFKDIGSYVTLQIDMTKGVVTLNKKFVDSNRTMFTKKIGGTSNSYYLYPNFEYQKESNLYKKFKAIAYTFENSVMLYANEENRKLAQPILDYIRAYDEDILGLKSYEKGNYFLIITINGKTIYELMPEIWDNYYDNFVDAHISKNVKKIVTHQLQEQIDFITHKKELCGYNPNVKFFTMDNYNDKFKPQIIEKLPMSKETAIAIKKGWMYAIRHLKFYHKGLEYIIIPSMVDFDDEVYKRVLKYLRNSNNNMKNVASKEDSFVRRLSKQVEGFDKGGISLDILFTEVNLTNLSVKIFATLEDVIPSRINQVVKEMKNQKISANIKREEGSKDVYLRDYFSREELFAIVTKNTSGMKNRVIQEKIFLAKLLLGYAKINHSVLLQKFEYQREYDYEHKRKLTDEGIKKWITYSNSFVSNEDRVLDFLESIDAIKNIGVKR
jgi:CRISPR-associated protein Csh1